MMRNRNHILTSPVSHVDNQHSILIFSSIPDALLRSRSLRLSPYPPNHHFRCRRSYRPTLSPSPPLSEKCAGCLHDSMWSGLSKAIPWLAVQEKGFGGVGAPSILRENPVERTVATS